jgi:hypothetical protein
MAQSGQSNGGGGFAGLVKNALEHKHEQTGEDEEKVRKAPSKGLPSTGLKKNTLEWKERNGREGSKENEDDRPSTSRQTSSSSIPSDAAGEEDERSGRERRRDQEGPLGKGPGRHEPQIKLNGGDLYDSPVEEKDMPSIPAPRGSAGDGSATPVPPEYFQDQAKEDIPEGGHGSSGKGKEKGDSTGRPQNGIDPEEHTLSRNESKIAKRFTDEAGHYPEGLLATKDEAPPGSQNTINLKSRTPLIHVSVLDLPRQQELTKSTTVKKTTRAEESRTGLSLKSQPMAKRSILPVLLLNLPEPSRQSVPIRTKVHPDQAIITTPVHRSMTRTIQPTVLGRLLSIPTLDLKPIMPGLARSVIPPSPQRITDTVFTHRIHATITPSHQRLDQTLSPAKALRMKSKSMLNRDGRCCVIEYCQVKVKASQKLLQDIIPFQHFHLLLSPRCLSPLSSWLVNYRS